MGSQTRTNGSTSLSHRQSLQEYLRGTRRLNRAISIYALVNLRLRRAEDRDMHLVPLAQDIRIRSLRTIRSAEHIHRRTRKERMAIDIIASSRRNFIYHKSILERRLSSRLTRSSLRCIPSSGHHIHATRSCSRRICLCSRLLSLHLVQDFHHPTLIVRILRRRDVIHINTVLYQTSTHLRQCQSTSLQLILSH